VILWRIAAETRRYAATDLSGAGAAASPGRWNDDGQPAVYCAPTIAMAVLETAAHIDDAGLPLNRFVVRIEVPDRVWASRTVLAAADLPPGWAAVPAGRGSVEVGAAWLRDRAAACLQVPSVIVQEESVVVINPLHPDCAMMEASTVRTFDYARLFRDA
jgi:RES domain-containing protein